MAKVEPPLDAVQPHRSRERRGFYSNIEERRDRQYALDDPLLRAAQGHREDEKPRCGGSRTKRYRCKDDTRDTRTKSKLTRVAVAALCRRDLKNDLLKSGHRWPSDEVTWTRQPPVGGRFSSQSIRWNA